MGKYGKGKEKGNVLGMNHVVNHGEDTREPYGWLGWTFDMVIYGF